MFHHRSLVAWTLTAAACLFACVGPTDVDTTSDPSETVAQAVTAPRTGTASVLTNLDYDELLAIRKAIRASDPAIMPAYGSLLRSASTALSATPLSVMDKSKTAPSGDKHDFYAIGNYSWPNPATPDGMPYIRRDGYRNPEATGPTYDKGAYGTTVSRIRTLSLAYFYSGDEAYAAKARTLLRTWFIDPTTKMNPNLDFAGGQPGVSDGVPIGIIESAVLIEMLDYVRLLGQSVSWTSADDAALREWFFDYTTWLVQSPFGQVERQATNNHGVWYAAQVAVFSKYSGQGGNIAAMAALGRQQIESQIAADGSLPRELTRTKSFHYSIYCLRAFVSLARLVARNGEDLWHYTAPNGRNLDLAFRFIAPYLSDDKAWTWPELEPGSDIGGSLGMARLAAKVYRTQPLVRAAVHLADTTTDTRSRDLLGSDPTEVEPAFEDFDDYATGASLSGLSGGSGWAGAWSSVSGAKVASTSISYSLGGRKLGGGKSLKVTSASSNAFGRSVLTIPERSGQPYFVSFLVRAEGGTGALPGDTTSPFAGWQAVDGTPDHANDTIGVIGKSGKAGTRVGGSDSLTSKALEYGRTYFVVIAYGGWNGSTYGTATLWLDPDVDDESTTNAAIKATKTTTTTGEGSDGLFGFLVRTVSLSESNYYLFDDVRVGRSWRDVVPRLVGARDDFDSYWPGTAVDGLDSGTGWASAWNAIPGVSVSSEEISYPLTSSYTLGGGNSMKVAASSSSAFSRALLPVADASGRSYYASFIFRAKGGSGALPSDGSSPFLGVQALDTSPSPATDSIGLIGKGGRAGARVGSTDATLASALDYNRTYFAVVQYRGWNGTSYESATLWLNPTIDDQLTTNPAIKISAAVNGGGSDGFLGLAARTVGLGPSSYYLVDELRIGRSWTEVVAPPH